ncbi:MAG: hypothetical protein ACRDRK_01290, partial [Pseudonocardia sp.]
GADGTTRSRAETDHTRAPSTVFGQAQTRRRAYRAPGRPNLHPADAALNLPAQRHSHGLRPLAVTAVTEATRLPPATQRSPHPAAPAPRPPPRAAHATQ